MANDYYQEVTEESNEEEAWVYHTILDTSGIINKYGADFFIKKLGNDSFEKLAVWFYSTANPDQEKAWLLTQKD